MESGEEHNYFNSCPRLVATIVGRIDLGYASNLMRVLTSLTAQFLALNKPETPERIQYYN